jgi:LPS export ABC transporter permease LptG
VFGKLDRYIIRGYMGPFLVATGVIVGLYVVAEAFSNLDIYLREAGSFFDALWRMGQVYALRLPTLLVPVLPIGMLVGAAYGIAQLSTNNEMTAMKASGLSFWRIMTPVYAISVLIAFAGFANRELLVPAAERLAAPAMQRWMGKKDKNERVVMYLEREQTLFTVEYSVAREQVMTMTITQKLPDGQSVNLMAREAEYTKGGWVLRGVQSQGKALNDQFWATALRPRDIEMELLPPDVQPLRVINRLLRKAGAGTERQTLLVRYYEHLAYPFAGIVLVGLGVPFVVSNERIQRSRMIGMGVCIIICMVFYTIRFVCIDLGESALLPPGLSGFLPIGIFAGVGMYMLENVHT